MEKKIFENGLIVKSGKSKIIFETSEEKNANHSKIFRFTEQEFKDFIVHIQLVSNKVWSTLNPKEAQSEASDYFEYYDKELDNDGF